MRKFLMILVLPLVLFCEDLPYDYVDSLDYADRAKATKKSNTKKKRVRRVIKRNNETVKNQENLPYDYTDDLNLTITKDNVEQVEKRNKKILGQKKEPDGFFIGAGFTVTKVLNKGDDYSREIYIDSAPLNFYQILTFHALYNPKKPDGGVELLFGYKWFWGSGIFGTRVYFNYNARFLEILTSHNFSLLNCDLLVNIIRTEPFKLGLFAGFGLGVTYEQLKKDYCFGGDCNMVEMSVNGNFGIRAVIYNDYSIELAFQPRYAGWRLTSALAKSGSTYNYDYDRYYEERPLSNRLNESSLVTSIRFIYAF